MTLNNITLEQNRLEIGWYYLKTSSRGTNGKVHFFKVVDPVNSNVNALCGQTNLQPHDASKVRDQFDLEGKIPFSEKYICGTCLNRLKNRVNFQVKTK